MIKNLPKNARDYRFVLYREVKGEKIYFGAYNDEKLTRLVVALTGCKVC